MSYKGVRLDVYARDTEHTHYNIEMQAENSTAEYPREKLRRSSGKTGNVSEICQSRTKGEPTGFWRSLCPEASRVYFVCEASREMEERFMVLEEMLRDERSRGRVEGKTEAKAEYVLEVLSSYGKVPASLNERIIKEQIRKYWIMVPDGSEKQFHRGV